MPGRGPAPKEHRRNRSDVPLRGEWQPTPDEGWQHGEIPPCPDGLMEASRVAWDVWLRAWFAAHWTPDDLPGLRQLVRVYDQVERGEFTRMAELRLGMDTYGITPKGQQDRRWVRPKKESEPSQPQPRRVAAVDHYAHLKVVNE